SVTRPRGGPPPASPWHVRCSLVRLRPIGNRRQTEEASGEPGGNAAWGRIRDGALRHPAPPPLGGGAGGRRRRAPAAPDPGRLRRRAPQAVRAPPRRALDAAPHAGSDA